MSDTDKSNKDPNVSRPDWRLPEVIDIKIRLIAYHAPQLRNFKSKFARYNKAIEFVVKIDRSIPARALSPAIFVDNVQIIEGEIIDRNTIRFLSFEPDKLKEDAPISWGWQDDLNEFRKRTGFRYHKPITDD